MGPGNASVALENAGPGCRDLLSAAAASGAVERERRLCPCEPRLIRPCARRPECRASTGWVGRLAAAALATYILVGGEAVDRLGAGASQLAPALADASSFGCMLFCSMVVTSWSSARQIHPTCRRQPFADLRKLGGCWHRLECSCTCAACACPAPTHTSFVCRHPLANRRGGRYQAGE